MNTPSKRVVDRQRSTLEIVTLILENVDEVAASVGEWLTGDSATVPDLAPWQALMAQGLRRRLELLVRHDKAQIDHQTEELGPRARRDAAAERVRERLVLLRQAASIHFGERGVELVPILAATARTPESLWRQAHHTLERIADDGRPSPPPRIEGLPTDLTPWLSDLEHANTELRQALDDLATHRARVSSARIAKNRHLAALDHEARSIVRVLSGLYALTGRADLAERVKQPLRRLRLGAPDSPSRSPVTETVGEGSPGEGAE